ncbi:MAG: PilZ domain-containing protein [Planctomycetota bacterium]|nr:MAG: PilZ domain-containing protein [Planctomycetota bacterium]
MFDDAFGEENVLNNESAFDMLQELERNTPDEIRRQRTSFRISIKAKVTLLPGNASELLKFRVQGVTGDLSEGGCRALFPMPVVVGDIYRLEFDRETIDLPLTFARCVRCLLLREDAFEAGFMFFTPVSLPANVDLSQHAASS